MKLLTFLLLFASTLFAENLPHLNLDDYSDKSKKASITVANQYYVVGNHNKALYYLKSTLKEHPNFYDAMVYVAHIYQMKGENLKSLKYLKKALVIDSNKAEAYYHRGVYHLTLEDTANAVNDFSLAITKNPNFHYGYDIFLQLRSFPSWNAVKTSNLNTNLKQQMIQQQFSAINTAYNIGLFQLNMGENKLALDNFKQCLNTGPYIAESHFSMGLAYYYTRNYAEALKSFSLAAGMDHRTSETKIYLSHISRLNKGKKK